MSDIARYDCEIMNQSRRGDLFVQRVLRIGYAKAAPYVGDFFIDRKDSIGVIGGKLQEPPLKPLRLRLIATVTNSFDPLAKFSDCDNREIEIRSICAGA